MAFRYVPAIITSLSIVSILLYLPFGPHQSIQCNIYLFILPNHWHLDKPHQFFLISSIGLLFLMSFAADQKFEIVEF